LEGRPRDGRLIERRRLAGNSILGIVPFYGTLSGVYLIASVGWGYRCWQYWGSTMLLQVTVLALMVAELGYSALAFGYYLYVDLDTDATAKRVFAGVYQGFELLDVRRDPLGVAVASYRFLLVATTSALTLFLADGLFVTRQSLRKRTILASFLLVCGQLLLLVLQPALWLVRPWLDPVLNVALLALWLAALLWAAKCTWRRLYAEAEADTQADLEHYSGPHGFEFAMPGVRWATPLKQRVFKMVSRAVCLYPLLAAAVYALFFVFEDSYQWMWLRLVTYDVWMLLVLGPAAWHWAPHSHSANYAPIMMEEIPAAASVMESASVALEEKSRQIAHGLKYMPSAWPKVLMSSQAAHKGAASEQGAEGRGVVISFGSDDGQGRLGGCHLSKDEDQDEEESLMIV